MLKRFFVDNYKCLVNFDMGLPQVGCLVGPNGSGKSAFFSALQGLQAFLSGAPIEDAFQSWTRTRWASRERQRFEMEVIGRGGTPFRYELLVLHEEKTRRSVVEHETVSSSGALLYEQVNGEVRLFGDEPTHAPRTAFPSDPRRSFLSVLQPRPDSRLLAEFKEWHAKMWLFSLRPFDISPDSTGEASILTTDGKNFVSWYRTILQETPAMATQIWEDLRPVIPGLQTISLGQLGLNTRALFLECQFPSAKPFRLSIAEISEGQRSLLLLYTILHALAPAASLIVFDEPDNFVAEVEIEPWLSRIREVVVDAKRGTLIAISHHPQVIDYLAADQVWELSRTEEGPTRIRDINVPREKGMTASEFLRLGVADGK